MARRGLISPLPVRRARSGPSPRTPSPTACGRKPCKGGQAGRSGGRRRVRGNGRSEGTGLMEGLGQRHPSWQAGSSEVGDGRAQAIAAWRRVAKGGTAAMARHGVTAHDIARHSHETRCARESHAAPCSAPVDQQAYDQLHVECMLRTPQGAGVIVEHERQLEHERGGRGVELEVDEVVVGRKQPAHPRERAEAGPVHKAVHAQRP